MCRIPLELSSQHCECDELVQYSWVPGPPAAATSYLIYKAQFVLHCSCSKHCTIEKLMHKNVKSWKVVMN